MELQGNRGRLKLRSERGMRSIGGVSSSSRLQKFGYSQGPRHPGHIRGHDDFDFDFDDYSCCCSRRPSLLLLLSLHSICGRIIICIFTPHRQSPKPVKSVRTVQ